LCRLLPPLILVAPLHDTRAPHSFPTRRSSDLDLPLGRRRLAVEVVDGPEVDDPRDHLLVVHLRRDPERQRLAERREALVDVEVEDRKSTRLNSSHVKISYAVFCLKKKKIIRPA